MSDTEAFVVGRRAVRIGLIAILLVLPVGCGKDGSGDATSSGSQPAQPAKPVQVLSFPEALHVPDASVNEFVTKAMNACAQGDYDGFRLLWSARQQPLERAEFEAGWLAVQAIEVRALERIKLATTAEDGSERLDEHYVFLAEVRFDPQHPAGRREPVREVVLLLTKEQDQWRLAQAPGKIRTWIRERVGTGTAPPPAAPNEHLPGPHSGTDGG